MARVACTHCTRQFRTENGLAWHVAREHANVGVRSDGDGSAEAQGSNVGLAAGEAASAGSETTTDALSHWLAEVDATVHLTAEFLSSVQDRVDGLSARFEELASQIARHGDDHAPMDSALRHEIADLRDQVQAASVLAHSLDWSRQQADGPKRNRLLRLAHRPDVAQLKQARQTVERAVDHERDRFFSESLGIDFSAVPVTSSWQRSKP